MPPRKTPKLLAQGKPRTRAGCAAVASTAGGVSDGRPPPRLPQRERGDGSYGWGKTKGYQNLKDRDLVPPPVMTHPDRWRLDQLLAWEGKRMAMAEAALGALVAPGRDEATVSDLLPRPKRRHRFA
ncbi:MAG TPA: hypothetical protein VFJ97_07820 [Dermatophilaceae bacterium]|nr:hypothetical protein [Dermatophilaceae bacterium]